MEDIDLIKLPELPVIEVVDDLIQVYKEFMVIRAALQLKLFDWMAAHGPATIEEVSKGTKIPMEYMAPLIGMLFYLDIVRRSGEKYLVSPSANLHFVSSSRYYQGDIILALAEPESPWNDLQTYLTSPEVKSTFEQESPLMSMSRAEQEIRGMLKNITTVASRWAGFKDAKSFLEISSGHGLYAMAACQIHPDLKASVLVQPVSSELLKQNIARHEMKDRVTPVSGNLGALPEGKFDIILISHALYADQNQCDAILKDVSAHLNDGGLFISNHWFIRDSEGTGMQGLYELELGIHNTYHAIKDREGYEKLCNDNGLVIFQTGVLRSAYGESTIHVATKTGSGA
ncbi:class I SAM-dependent methyltransferase [uncultured Methanospirillum sp.]|uniref:class I SAM-dependent methyltransferase n=1 Tax=uncultured Methanospirillum sp. TaxID=262503 RepID=UPI0029C6F3E9|nr:class I SAM-dependent methyltransferase [uncultured Methanospirillum sp.]